MSTAPVRSWLRAPSNMNCVFPYAGFDLSDPEKEKVGILAIQLKEKSVIHSVSRHQISHEVWLFCLLVGFSLGPQLAVLRVILALYLGVIPASTSGTQWEPGIKPGTATCKAKALSALLSLRPQFYLSILSF